MPLTLPAALPAALSAPLSGALPAAPKRSRALLSAFALLLLMGGSAARAACNDPGSGATGCDSAGVATQGNSSGVDVGVANPINVITGNKYQREVDLPALPGVLGLEIVRHYNSRLASPASRPGLLGRGWRLSYETTLAVTGRTLTIAQADGTPAHFTRDLVQPDRARVLYRAASPLAGQVWARRTPQGTEYVWVWRDGRELMFNRAGRLVQITAPTGEFVSLQHDVRGWLVKVTDPQGRSLHLHYLDAASIATDPARFRGVVAIDSPVGRFRYEYGNAPPKGTQASAASLAANLVKVNIPTHHDANQPVHAWTTRGVSSSSVARAYHYEDARHPTLLTGMSVLGQGSDGVMLHQRLVTWGYDDAGRANLSVKGEPRRYETDAAGKVLEPKRVAPGTGIEQVTLAWPKPGETVLTNSLGQTTVYRTGTLAGERRILEARGAGCASCGPVNVRYGYDSLGRLVEETQLGQDGTPMQGTRMERDGLGRVVRVSTLAYAKGKAQPTQWALRVVYASPQTDAPMLIARPSVVAGKEHQTRIVYNNKGQPLTVTETGFSPIDATAALADARGVDLGKAAQPLSRTTRYTYQSVNGRSLLTEIDGPLANGPTNSPADSDLTRLQWDATGSRIVGWTDPGSFTSTIDYETGTGRIARVGNGEGVTTTFVHGTLGQLVHTSTAGPAWPTALVQAFKYNALGHRTEAGTGSATEKTYRAQVRAQYDASGRLQWSASALGVLQQQRYDTESNLVESLRYGAGMSQVQQYVYDPFGRLVQSKDSKGAALTIGYDAQGLPQRLTDALGRTLDLRRSQPANRSASPPVRQLRDDFGRIVLTLSPDSGTLLRRFDAADRLVAGTDALGNQADYHYDAAGRIARQRITDRQSGQVTQTVWQYAGQRLIAIDHPEQSERYEHDARGLLLARTMQIKGTDGGEVATVTRYRYNDQGQLLGSSLPDGSELRYERNGQGQIVALQRYRLQTAWLRWLLPTQTIASDIERDLVGIKAYTAGNGIEAKYQRSREGVLARTVYRSARPQTVANTSLPALGHALQWLTGIAHAHAADATLPPANGQAQSQATAAAAAADNSAAAPLPGALGMPADPQALFDTRYLWDAQGNLLHTQSKDARSATASYAYDRDDRLIIATAATATGQDTSRYFYDAAGNRVLRQQGITDQTDVSSNTVKTTYQPGSHRWRSEGASTAAYDQSGQPRRIGEREYRWDALGKLIEVRQENRTLARYRYNHRGERIAKQTGTDNHKQAAHYLYQDRKLSAELNAHGRLVRQYVYLGAQPIAVIDTPEGKNSRGESSLLQQLTSDLGTVLQAWFSNGEQLHWLHPNHLGAVEAATDVDGKLVWQVRYGAFGEVRQLTIGNKEKINSFMLQLRLPGQYEDAETGLYYNGARYYDPQQGRYLTPDPLGTPDGPNPYLYVRNNPLKYIDPSGLVLFAFDGTDNTDDETWLDNNNSSFSNVVRFRDAYGDGEKRYVTGVGTDHARRDKYADIISADFTGLLGQVPDRGGNLSGPTRIERMLLYIGEEAEATPDNEVMQVDIVGFSRGAAQARDFANRITAATRNGIYSYQARDNFGQLVSRCQKVNFRFMGLWDTVLSTNRSGTRYNLGIAPEFSYVAQAVALNEYRSAPAGVNASLGAFTDNFPYWDNTRTHLPGDNHYGGFPLESIGSSYSVNGNTRIERGFIGAHADIGGGYGENERGLATVALSWMVAQAQLAGVKMDIQDIEIDMNNPIVHDQSNALRVGNPLTTPTFQAPGKLFGTNTYEVEDRQINGGLGGGTQRTHRFGRAEPGGNRSMTNADTHAFINYTARNTAGDTRRTQDIPGIPNLQNRTGTVDMQNYMSWLRQHGYTFAGEW